MTKNKHGLPCISKDLIKAISHPKAHFGPFKHAVDFILPEGSEILATYDGKVVDVKIDSQEGGLDPKYSDPIYLNYITIEHEKGEYSQYAHLKHNSSLVKKGDPVKKGQPIALSGNTGLSTTPHLHYMVFELRDNEIGWESIDITFEEHIDIDRSDKEIPEALNDTIDELDRIKKSLEDN